MKSNFENEVLTVMLSGRIDSNNAAEAEKEIFDKVEECGAESVILDAEYLEYISSAGLRVVLKLKKAISDSKIINASSEVCEIFEMTGFSDIIDVEKAMREISVEGCEKIGEGGFGIVYRLNPDTIVKIYKKEGIENIKKEMNFAKQAFIKGVPTAISYDIVKCDGKVGVVFELIRSDTLSNSLMNYPERLDEYVGKYVDLMRTVHSTVFIDVAPIQTNDLYRERFKDIRQFLSDDEWNALMEIIDSVPEKDTMVHGDMHTRNIMLQDGELLLIDMDELKCGHAIYDLANIFFAYRHLVKQGRAEQFIGMNDEMCEKFINKFIELYFADLGESELDTVIKGIDAFAMMRYAYTILLAVGQGIPRVAEVLKQSVLPNRELIKDTIDLL